MESEKSPNGLHCWVDLGLMFIRVVLLKVPHTASPCHNEIDTCNYKGVVPKQGEQMIPTVNLDLLGVSELGKWQLMRLRV